MFRKILVAVDGSEHARNAAFVAARLARSLGAALTLLTVYRQPPGFEGEPYYSEALENAINDAQRLLDGVAAEIVADGGPTPDTSALGGEPVAEVREAAAAGGYDLIVVGTRGLGRLQSALLGSVSGQLAANSCCPVLVVHEGHGGAERP